MLQDLDLVRRRLLLAGLALGLVTPAQARGYRVGGPDGLAQDAAQQQALLSTGALAYKTSMVALRRSPNPDVRAFAQSEIAEQRAISAAVTGSPQPVVPVGRHGAAILAEARSLRGGLTFDRVYVGRQIEGHQRLHALAQGYARAGADREVASIARGALPLIRRHLAILQELDGALNA